MFFKGTAFVRVIGGIRQEAVIECARQLAATLDEGEGEVPPLVKHLPEADTAQERAAYAVSLRTLQEAAGNRPVLDAVSFDGGAEAITASYGPTMRLVIVEHATPQLATDNDTRIGQRLEELRSNQQPQPSAYKRVGNYAVFVFDAPSEEAVANLIKDVRYEQVVRWLGDNPRAFERAQRAYGEMTANVILTTLKATGLAMIVCLCTGGLFGGLVFMRRRAQAVANQSYSDAGGMVRLNIDESLIRKD